MGHVLGAGPDGYGYSPSSLGQHCTDSMSLCWSLQQLHQTHLHQYTTQTSCTAARRTHITAHSCQLSQTYDPPAPNNTVILSSAFHSQLKLYGL